MKQTGELLRQARENAKLSLSEVALSTKINPKILTAIENGDTAHLPAKTFLKGFIRSYAVYLKMDPDDVMKTFNAEIGPPPAVNATDETPRPSDESTTPAAPPAATRHRRVGDDESFSGFRAMAVAVIVILIGLIIGTRELIEKYQREKVTDGPQEIKVSPLAESPPATSVSPDGAGEAKRAMSQADHLDEKPGESESKGETAKPAGVVQAAEIVKQTETASSPPESTAKSEPKAEAKSEVKPMEAKTPELIPSPIPMPGPPPTVPKIVEKPAETKPEPGKPAAETTAGPNPILKSAKNEIILEALDKVEVKFKVRGKAKTLSLGPTQVHTIFADEPILLDVSDGGAVNIILNGRERGVPGDLGKPKQVSIP